MSAYVLTAPRLSNRAHDKPIQKTASRRCRKRRVISPKRNSGWLTSLSITVHVRLAKRPHLRVDWVPWYAVPPTYRARARRLHARIRGTRIGTVRWVGQGAELPPLRRQSCCAGRRGLGGLDLGIVLRNVAHGQNTVKGSGDPAVPQTRHPGLHSGTRAVRLAGYGVCTMDVQ
jgi:hypothetical protein